LINNKSRGVGTFSLASANLVLFKLENLSLIFNLVIFGAELFCQEDIPD